jgi:hypothetical protein
MVEGDGVMIRKPCFFPGLRTSLKNVSTLPVVLKLRDLFRGAWGVMGSGDMKRRLCVFPVLIPSQIFSYRIIDDVLK